MSIGSDINRIVAWTQRCSFAYHADEAAEVDALNDISCAIPQGEIAILCGQSGCGKTTYTRLLNGLIPGFYSGDLQGIHMTCGIRAGLAPVESYVGQVGSVFQNPKTQYFNADSTDELAFPCENTGMSPARIRQRVHDVAEQFHIRHLLGRRIMTLSGGQKQQLAVAALPDILSAWSSSGTTITCISRLCLRKARMPRSMRSMDSILWRMASPCRYAIRENGTDGTGIGHVLRTSGGEGRHLSPEAFPLPLIFFGVRLSDLE